MHEEVEEEQPAAKKNDGMLWSIVESLKIVSVPKNVNKKFSLAHSTVHLKFGNDGNKMKHASFYLLHEVQTYFMYFMLIDYFFPSSGEKKNSFSAVVCSLLYESRHGSWVV